jgi:hypothetical protein
MEVSAHYPWPRIAEWDEVGGKAGGKVTTGRKVEVTWNRGSVVDGTAIARVHTAAEFGVTARVIAIHVAIAIGVDTVIASWVAHPIAGAHTTKTRSVAAVVPRRQAIHVERITLHCAVHIVGCGQSVHQVAVEASLVIVGGVFSGRRRT